MRTARKIRLFIMKLKPLEIFTTRDVLFCGPRGAIDQYLFRQVKKGLLYRLARGMFVRCSDPDSKPGILPTPREIARIKAKAFGKKIMTHAKELLSEFRLNGIQSKSPIAKRENPTSDFIFPTNGRSSEFKYGDLKIKFASTSPKAFKLGDDITGQLMRVIAYCGRKQITVNQMNAAVCRLMRPGRENISNMVRWAPQWVAEHFLEFHPPNRAATKRIFRDG
jgi:hypothetical protein